MVIIASIAFHITIPITQNGDFIAWALQMDPLHLSPRFLQSLWSTGRFDKPSHIIVRRPTHLMALRSAACTHLMALRSAACETNTWHSDLLMWGVIGHARFKHKEQPKIVQRDANTFRQKKTVVAYCCQWVFGADSFGCDYASTKKLPDGQL